jgi:restriction endonuclease S subunit
LNDPSATEFDEVYYEKLMDGLEISEIRLSDLERTTRIDAEFYQKKNLFIEQVLDKWDKSAFSKCFNVSDGNHMSISDDFCNEGVPYYRGQDIYNLFIENSNPLYISKGAYNKAAMRRSYLKKGDVLMSIVGAIIGNSALVTSDREATCSCKLAILRSCDESIMPETMLIFIKTKYGQNQIQKFKRGAAQTGLLLEDFEQLFIPKFSMKFQYICKEYVDSIKILMDEAVHIYSEAEKLLIETLGLENFNPEADQYCIKSFKNSYGNTGRLDAEFYQQKYDEYEHAVLTYNDGCVRIRDRFQLIKTKCLRNLNEYHYVEIGDINIGNGSSAFNVVATENLPDNAKIMTRKGDVIVSTVRPNRGAVSILEEDNLLVSGAFTVLRQNSNYPKELLQILLRTEIYRDWLLKYNVGTSYPVIKDDDILNMPIPLFTNKVEQEVIQMVKKSQKSRRQSEQLLEYAKRAVETAIEQGEDVAIAVCKQEGVING